MRLVLVEDNSELGHRLVKRLHEAGFAVDWLTDYRSAASWPDTEAVDAAILDLGLPDGDGLELLAKWRNDGIDCPILILTARGGWQEKVAGLNAGADDFVVKPVRFEELAARLNALLRRATGKRDARLHASGIVLDTVARQAWLGDSPLDLTRQEYRLLHLFMRAPGQVLAQPDLLTSLYERGAEREANSLEVLVSRLRRKIGRHRIATVRGMGYRLTP